MNGESDGVVSTQQGQSRMSVLARPLSRRIHNMGLLPRLLVAEVIVFGVVFAGGTLLISQMTNSLRDDIIQHRLLMGQVIAEDLDASLEHGVVELQQLSVGYRLAVRRGDQEGVQRALELLAGESTVFTHGILIVGPEGKMLSTDTRQPALAALDMMQYWPELWSEDTGASEVLTSAFHVEGQTSPSVAIAVPVVNGNSGEYVIGLLGALDSYPSQTVTRAIRLGDSGHADIVDERGIALFSTEADHVLESSDHQASYRKLFERGGPLVSELPHEQNTEARDEPHLMAFIPLQTLPWAISSGTTVSEAFDPVREQWSGGLSFLAALTSFAFVGTVFVGRQLVQPMRILSLAARTVAEGNRAVTVRIPWGGEIGELASSLETMRLRLQASGAQLEEQVQLRTTELEERNRELSALYETLQGNGERLRELLGKILGAQEEERKRVSRDLHDGIGQALSALSMGLERLEQARPDQWPNFRKNIEELRELATYTLGDLRRLTIALRPAALDDLGLVPAIRRYAELHLENAGVDFQVGEEGAGARLDPTLETVVYRVVQEAINNVSRHSGATHASVSLKSEYKAFVAIVKDDGQGFDPSSLTTSEHGVGLQGMEERASLAGGRLTIDSHPGQGTTVRLEVPFTERTERVERSRYA